MYFRFAYSILAVFLLLNFQLTNAQDVDVFNSYKMQPEVYSFPQTITGDVDAKGDLTISVPIMTVPGRNGLDFNISFDYRSSIKVEDVASWVGLGWNFAPGSVTRDVMGHLRHGFQVQKTGPDYNLVKEQQPDRFFVKIPGKGTFEMRRTWASNFNQDPDGFWAPYDTASFYLVDYKPYKIEYFTLSQLSETEDDALYDSLLSTIVEQGHATDDIGGFTITTDDGMQYVYRLPTKAYHKDMSDGAEHWYVNAWRLVAILSPGFPKMTDHSASALSVIDGNWITFDYEFFPGSGNAQPDNYFLKTITTPTHKAEFAISSGRQDWNLNGISLKSFSGDAVANARKLDNIQLKNLISNNYLESIKLEQDYSLANISSGSQYGKLSLREIRYFSGSITSNYEKPSYKFSYAYNPTIIHGFPYYDGFGYYNTSLVKLDAGDPSTYSGYNWGLYTGYEENYDGTAWSLTQIEFPTGGKEQYFYQNDVIATEVIPFTVIKYIDQYNTFIDKYNYLYIKASQEDGTNDFTVSGGARVAEIRRIDGMGIAERIMYGYGEGRISGLPDKIMPYLGVIGDLSNANVYSTHTRGKVEVFYDRVTKWEGMGYTEYHYITDLFGFGALSYSKQLKTIFYANGTSWVYMTGDDAPGWGKLHKVVKQFWDYTEETSTDLALDRIRPTSSLINLVDSAFTFNVPGTQFDLRTNKIKKEITYSSGLSRLIQTKYQYHPHTSKVSEEIVTYDDKITTKSIEYAHDNYSTNGTDWAYNDAVDSLRLNNQLTEIAKSITKVKDSEEVEKIVAIDIKTYKKFTENDWWLNDRTYSLNMSDFPDSETGIEFDYWDTDPGEVTNYLKTSTISYDQYGQVTQNTLPNGSQLKLFYGDNTNPYSNTSSTIFKNSLLTGLQYINESELLQRKVVYDDSLLKPVSIYDENGNTSNYVYDDYHRLMQIKNDSSKIVKEYSYIFSRDSSADSTYNPLEPNQVIEITNLTSGGNEHITKSFIDGLSIPIQSLIQLPTRDIIKANATDIYGRIIKEYNPYELMDNGGKYDSLYWQRSPDGGVFNIFPWQNDVVAGLNYGYLESSITENVPLANLLSDTILYSWNTTFFNQAGTVNIKIEFSDGRPDYLDTVSAAYDSVFFLETQKKEVMFIKGSCSSIDVTITCQEGFTSENDIGKKYIYSKVNTRDAFDINCYYTSFDYINDSEEKKNITYPGSYDLSTTTEINREYKKANDIIEEESIQILEDTTRISVPTDFVLYEETKFSNQILYEYETIDILEDQQCEIHWVSKSQDGSVVSFSISCGTDTSFNPISESIWDDSIGSEELYIANFKAGHTYSIVVGVETGSNQVGFSLSRVYFRYISTQLNITNFDYTLKKVETIDEIGNSFYEYLNSDGKTVFSAQSDGTDTLKTYFQYDHAGNLTTVKTPKYFEEGGDPDFNIYYSYNTLGQLVRKDSPDEGVVKYKYDKSGNLVFSQNAVDSTAGEVKFTVYDFANRPIKTGKMLDTLSSLDPNDFTFSDSNVSNFYYFDSDPATSEFDTDAQDDIQAFSFDNPVGHLVASKYKSGGKWQIELYNYDNENRVDKKWIITQGIDATAPTSYSRYEMDYQFNLLGMIIEKSVTFNGSIFKQKFGYNDLMQLDTVYADAQGVWVEVANYDYNVAGLVEQSIFNKANSLTTDYAYNLRNWVTSINDVDVTSNPFAADYTYFKNGNIDNAEYYSNEFASNSLYRYDYSYDNANRLLTAQFQLPDGSSWTNSDKFTLKNLSYDANGNILSLKRYDEEGSPMDDLDFNYVNGNQINNVEDSLTTPGKNWDAEDTDYSYDAIGNVTSKDRTGGDDLAISDFNNLNLPETMTITGSTNVTMSMRYSISGQRFYKKTGSSPAEFYLMDGDVCLGVFDETGTLKYWNIYGNDLIGRFEP